MKIKNKYSRKRADKHYMLLNKIINIKKYIRIKTSKIKPLSKMEEFLYIEPVSSFDNENTTIPKNKYIKISDIFLLNIISKNDCKNLYAGLLNLYKDNYLKGYLGGELRTRDLKKCIDSYMSSTNHNKWTRLCDISPSDKELFELCDFVTISLFEISNDLIGISFDLNVTNKFNDTIKQIINEKIDVKTIYDKYKYKNKYVYSKSSTSIKEKRNNDYEDFILEFKSRFNKLFSKYLPLQLDYRNKAPISLNTYQTNFNVSDRAETFYQDLDILESFSAQERNDISVCVREKNKSDTFIKTKMWYNIGIEYNKIDRSNNILFFIEDLKYRIIHSSAEFINMFIASLTFYLLDEMQEDITDEKMKLYNCKTKHIKKNFKQYEVLNSKFHKYSSIFNGIDIHRIDYKDEYILNGFKHIKKMYKEYNKQLNELKKEYEFRTNINNIKSSYFLSLISIAIALLALSLSIYFEYRNKNNDSIKNIETKIKTNNNEIKEVNNYLNKRFNKK